ncbi:TIGR03619 family F420-dependent LLM class oxidoreductase [Pseudofrankia sp. BMG5.37]|uniref:TIGR03619 family F420-dependent LLM class oxidoreductase n=1 Tax=Pseudofrankia sp. BMG5.37 TaxID=3050035 RepID=UPI002895D2E0|nr:TIGR03619 family F420-dependent LLM class oxidoreductase [Pseudofrankia sp. BMG5.37]MDT3444936.1 TIGR03619 family F420-dependent LLM class oxidoreductase [Pseudofrankia sp. BMG5.37]
MKFGIRYSDTGVADIVTIAQAADSAGIESMWRGEHVLVPREIKSIDPYYARGLPPGMERFASLDPNTLAAYLSARTESIRFCMGVNLIALHNPYQLARVVATADIVSNGRIMLAVGVGWLREEFDIMGIDWATRGSRTDEAMAVVRALWRDPHPQFEGKHFHLPPVTFQPKPVQASPPLYVAGLSRFAFRRAARHGDGWYGHDLSVSEAAGIMRRIEEERVAADRMDHPFEYTTRAPHDISPAQVEEFAAIGVHRLVLDVGSAAFDGLSVVVSRLEKIGKQLVSAQ